MASSFSPDGTQIASVSSDGRSCSRRSLAASQELMRLPDGDFARSVEFSRDGTSLLIATDAGAVGLVGRAARPLCRFAPPRAAGAGALRARARARSARATTARRASGRWPAGAARPRIPPR